MSLTPKNQNPVQVPNTPTGESAANPAAPNSATTKAAVNPTAPNPATSKAAVNPAAPNSATSESPVEVAVAQTIVGTSENLALYSEQFNDAAWSKANSTISANATTAPDGELTADKLIDNAVSTQHWVVQTSTVLNATQYTFSIYAKAAELNWITLSIGGQGKYFDIANQLIGGNLGSAPDSAFITSLGNGYARCQVTVTTAATSAVIKVTLASADGSATYLGNGSEGVFIWGAQLNKGGLAPYVKTEATAKTGNLLDAPNSATSESVVNPSAPNLATTKALVNPSAPSVMTALAPAGVLRSVQPLFKFVDTLGLPDSVTYARSSSASYIETYKDPLGRFAKRLTNDYVGSVTNYAKYSEQFDNADWSKLNTTIQSNVEKNPIDGSRTADKATISNGANDRVWKDNVAVGVGVTFVWSVMVKNINSFDFAVSARPSSGTLQRAFFSFNGVANSEPQLSIESGTSVPFKKYLGDGWYQVGIVFVSAVSSYDLEFDIDRQGNIGSSVFLFGANFSDNKGLVPYVKTLDSIEIGTFTASPRYEEKGVLIEGAITNLAIHSEGFNNGNWNKSNSTLVPNSALSPDGSFSAGLFYPTTTGTQRQIVDTIPTSAGTYTVSCFFKSAGLRWVRIVGASGGSGAYFNVVDGVLGTVLGAYTAIIESVGDGWYRCSVSGAGADPNSFVQIILADADNSTTVTANGTSGLYIWGAQLENREFPTSYIRTEGATVSKSFDSLLAKIAPKSSNITGFVESSYLGDASLFSSNRLALDLRNDAGTNRVLIYNGSSSHSTTLVTTNNATVSNVIGDSGVGSNLQTAAVTINNGNFATYINGELRGANSGIPPFNLVNLGIGNNAIGGTSQLFGHIKRLEVYDLGLTVNEVRKL